MLGQKERVATERLLIEGLVDKSGFEAVLQMVVDEATRRCGGGEKPTIRQRRYRRLLPPLNSALDIAGMGRI